MIQRWLQKGVWVGGLVAIALPVQAQIVPDNTLGTEPSRVVPNVLIRGAVGNSIEGGVQRGSNLFHSFQQFNINDGQRVYFANPNGVQTILSRVTGANSSNILGTLGVNGTANLFLINPNGILFGANARLDIAGSFVASTASSLKFSDGSEFSATNPQAPPLLTVNIRPGLQYGANNTATITNRGNLTVGQDLTLAAGNLDLQGQLQAGGDLTLRALDTVQVRDSVTTPLIAAAFGKLLVQGDRTIDIFALNHPNSGFFAGKDLIVRSSTAIQSDAHFTSGGNFRIEQLDGTPGSFFSPNDPVIRANGNVTFTDYVGASLHIFAGGSVTANNITINAPDTTPNSINESVTLSNGTSLAIQGASVPTLDIRAGTSDVGTPEFTPNPPLGFTPNPTANGTPLNTDITINNIILTQPDGLIFLTNQYKPNLSLPDGAIKIGSAIAGGANIGTIPGLFPGNSGSVVIDSRSNLEVTGRIFASSIFGNAGDVTLLARNTVTLSGGGIRNNVGDLAGTPTQGKVGNVLIEAGNVFLTNTAQIQTGFFANAQGNPGNVTIRARETVSFSGLNSGIFANVDRGGIGDGSSVVISAKTLSLVDNAVLITSNAGRGNVGSISVEADRVFLASGSQIKAQIQAGSPPGNTTNSSNVTIRAGSIELEGIRGVKEDGNTGIFTNVEFGASGDGSNIQMFANSLTLTNDAVITANNAGGGKAGDISVQTTGAIFFSGGTPGFGTGISSIFGTYNGTSEQAAVKGAGGTISLKADSLSMSDRSFISTTTYASGNAGQINIWINGAVALREGFGAPIITSLVGNGAVGTGSDIVIGTKSLFIDGGLLSSAGSANEVDGSAGNIVIKVDESVNILNNAYISSEFSGNGKGRGGVIDIQSRSLELTGGSYLTALTRGTGNAGNIVIKVDESVNILNSAYISSEIIGDGEGRGGVIDIQSRSLELTGGSYLTALTRGTGNAGNIQIKASESVNISGTSTSSGFFTDTLESAKGDGGEITILAGTLRVSSGGIVSTRTQNNFRGGNIIVNVSNLEIFGGGRLATTTSSRGRAGDVKITAFSNANILGSGILPAIPFDFTTIGSESSGVYADTTTTSTGKGGDIQLIVSGRLNIRDRGLVNVRSQGTGDAGNLDIVASSVALENQGRVTAESALGRGGNINLQVQDLLSMRYNSLISATNQVAGSEGDGGNITINAPNAFLVSAPRENNDILSNSFSSRGGRIEVNAKGVFWFDFRSRNDLVQLLGTNNPDQLDPQRLQTNDVTAVSRGNPLLNGDVLIRDDSKPTVLSTLPTLVDPTKQIDQRCTPNQTTSSFTITGRGGVARSPTDPLMPQGALMELVKLPEGEMERQAGSGLRADETNKVSNSSAPAIPPFAATEIIEASRWIADAQGNVQLVADASGVQPYNLAMRSPTCAQRY